jgi:hypothetical protein
MSSERHSRMPLGRSPQATSHGMPTTQAETINADLLAFIKG